VSPRHGLGLSVGDLSPSIRGPYRRSKTRGGRQTGRTSNSRNTILGVLRVRRQGWLEDRRAGPGMGRREKHKPGAGSPARFRRDGPYLPAGRSPGRVEPEPAPGPRLNTVNDENSRAPWMERLISLALPKKIGPVR
jgi:hypothetical protein